MQTTHTPRAFSMYSWLGVSYSLTKYLVALRPSQLVILESSSRRRLTDWRSMLVWAISSGSVTCRCQLRIRLSKLGTLDIPRSLHRCSAPYVSPAVFPCHSLSAGLLDFHNETTSIYWLRSNLNSCKYDTSINWDWFVYLYSKMRPKHLSKYSLNPSTTSSNMPAWALPSCLFGFSKAR